MKRLVKDPRPSRAPVTASRGRRRIAATHDSAAAVAAEEERGEPFPVVLKRRCLGIVATACVFAMLGFSVHAIRVSPLPSPETAVVMVGDEVPRELQISWLKSFPSCRALFNSPGTEIIASFAAHLAEQPSVAEVRSVRLRPDPTGTSRVLAVDVVLHPPVLPVRLQDGSFAWLGAEADILHPSLTGADDLPVVIGIEKAPDNLKELLQAWPRIAARLPAGFITSIRCDAPQPGGRRFGIRLHTRSGTVIDWGPADCDRYGMDLDRKISNLVYTVTCNGDLKHVKRIDVRFPRPFAVVR